MVRDSTLTRNKDHASGTVIARADTIMACSSRQLNTLLLASQLKRRRTDSVDALLVELHACASPYLFDFHRTAVLFCDLVTKSTHALCHLVHSLVADVRDIDDESRLARYGAGTLRFGINDTYCGATFVFPRDVVHARDHAAGREQGVSTAVNGCRAAVLGAALDRHRQPEHALHASNNSDRLVRVLKNWSLLDVVLEMGREGIGIVVCLRRTLETDLDQLVPEGQALGVYLIVGIIQSDMVGPDSTREHTRIEACSLLVRPVYRRVVSTIKRLVST